jgi:hypothetical protein
MGRTTETKPTNKAGSEEKRLFMTFPSAVSIQVRYKKTKSERAEILEDKKEELNDLENEEMRELVELDEMYKASEAAIRRKYYSAKTELQDEIYEHRDMDRFIETRKRDSDYVMKKQRKGAHVTVEIPEPREMIDGYYKYL